jgi:parallel beta-helix repeat protein
MTNTRSGRLLAVAMLAAAAVLVVCAGLGAAAMTWTVDDGGGAGVNFTSIQQAINAASDGDTITVGAGTYIENVNVDKRLTLIGEGADAVNVTAASVSDNVFEVTANYVNISGFTVTGATGNDRAGIYITGADHCNIFWNNASNNYDGIWLYDSDNNVLTNNIASSNSMFGIFLWNSNNNALQKNNASNNCNGGISLLFSSDNCITNSITNSNIYYGISMGGSSNNMLTKNTVDLNTHCDIYVGESNNNTLQNNNVSNSRHGIILGDSNNNTLRNNNMSNNYNCGIYIIRSSSDNILYSNTMKSRGYGIRLENSSNNTVYNNYFDNRNNALNDDGNNIWNITPTAGINIIGGSWLGGNYWSDYDGADSDGDGLGDSEYPIAGGGNIDHHPLCLPEAFVKGDLNDDGILTPTDAAIALQLAASGAHDPAADVSGDHRVTSLDALMILHAAAGGITL